MIEHEPWVGEQYRKGLEGQRIGIVGYSHHGSDDSADVTNDVVYRVVSGEYRDLGFFNCIRGYFGFSQHSAFWPKVLFFNYIPNSIGSSDRKFAYASPEQCELAVPRLQRILAEHQPHKLFVFTKKGWAAFPATQEEETGASPRLGDGLEAFEWGTYHYGDQSTLAVGLRHPQGAPGKLMRKAVEQVLHLPLR